MRDHYTNGPQWAALKDKALLALGGTVITLTGVVIGLWSAGIENSIKDVRDGQRTIWRTLHERASLGPRTAAVEKQAEDLDRRLRELELLTARRSR